MRDYLRTASVQCGGTNSKLHCVSRVRLHSGTTILGGNVGSHSNLFWRGNIQYGEKQIDLRKQLFATCRHCICSDGSETQSLPGVLHKCVTSILQLCYISVLHKCVSQLLCNCVTQLCHTSEFHKCVDQVYCTSVSHKCVAQVCHTSVSQSVLQSVMCLCRENSTW